MHTRTQSMYIALVLAFSAATTPLIGGNGDSPTTIFETFIREGAVEITITTDLNELINNRRREEYQPGVLTYKNLQGVEVKHEIELVPRGKFRRRICDFPPVKLKFSKKELMAAGLKKYNNLKLSTHCLDDKEAGNFNVFKEYLAYKLYNELTVNSFRVQLVHVTYVDSKGVLKKMKRYGFLIEDDEELAERIGGKVCDVLNPSSDQIMTWDECVVSTFNYMIGNEDWSLSMVRNLKMIETQGNPRVIPVAYDFDFSGMVNASYALPSSDLGQRHIKDRDYLGMDQDPAVLQRVLEYFRQKRAVMYYTISQFKLLPHEHRLEIRYYLDSFYQSIEALPVNCTKLPSWRFVPPAGTGPVGTSNY